MAEELADGAHYVGAQTTRDFQSFIVGSPSPEECVELVKAYPVLIAEATIRVGNEASLWLRLEITGSSRKRSGKPDERPPQLAAFFTSIPLALTPAQPAASL
jgi:hypothetical protein